ncbi:MAG: NAD(P)H-binding protein, partial [Hafnia sp.]
MTPQRILVLGASGYIGQHLIPKLVEEGHSVRAAARRIDWLREQAWPRVECQYVDLHKPETLPAAVADIDVVYYLVHGMGDSHDFVTGEINAAKNTCEALRDSGVKQII